MEQVRYMFRLLTIEQGAFKECPMTDEAVEVAENPSLAGSPYLVQCFKARFSKRPVSSLLLTSRYLLFLFVTRPWRTSRSSAATGRCTLGVQQQGCHESGQCVQES